MIIAALMFPGIVHNVIKKGAALLRYFLDNIVHYSCGR